MIYKNNTLGRLLIILGLLGLLIGLLLLPGTRLMATEAGGMGVSLSLNSDPRHSAYPADSVYGKAEYLYDTLTICGSGMMQGEKIYSVKELENLYTNSDFGCDVTYSLRSSKVEYSRYTLSGVRLYELLVQAGLDTSLADSTVVTFMSKDGYRSACTLGDVRNIDQYNFYNEAGVIQASKLPVMVAFASNGYPLVGPIGSNVDGLVEGNDNGNGPLKNTFGQIVPGGFNALNNCKLLNKIIVGNDDKPTQHNRDPYDQYENDQLTIQLINSSTAEVTQSQTYTVKAIEAMVNAKKKALISNYYPDSTANHYEGIDLWYLLADQFGLTGNEGEFSFVDASGNESNHINLEYLRNPSQDYAAYYTTKEGLQISWVKPVLAYAQNGQPLQEQGPLRAALPQHKNYLSQGLVQVCTGINVYIVEDSCTHTTEPYSNWRNDQITFTGDGLDTSRDFTVENLEKSLELIQADNYTVDAETSTYRGISLYRLLSSDKLGLKLEADRIEVSSQDGSVVSFTLDELQSNDLKVMLAYGKNGQPLVPSEQDQGYDKSVANSGGPLCLVVNEDAGRCLTQVVQVKAIVKATESWKHDRQAPYNAYLDTTLLRICGSAMASPQVYTLRELEAMQAGIVREKLVAEDVTGDYEGLNLKYLLQTAGVVDIPSQVTVCSVYANEPISFQQLVADDVWSGITSTTQNGAIKPVVLAYAKDGYPLVYGLEAEVGYVTSVDNSYGPLRLVVENAKPLCVKYVAGIIAGEGIPVAYTVNYLDKISRQPIAAAKVSIGIAGEDITSITEKFEMDGYLFSQAEPANICLNASNLTGNVINLYYEKKTAENDCVEIGLVISGSGIPKLMYLTKDELKSIAFGEHGSIKREFRSYSALARGGIKTLISTLGIDLGDLLQQAGIGTDSYVVSTISADSNRVDLNYNGSSKMFTTPRYYYADILPGDNGVSGLVDPILSLQRAESNEKDSLPHLPGQDELQPVERFPLPTLTVGQTNQGDFNNQYNNKYVQQVIVGNKYAKAFSITGGLAKKLSYTIPELMLKGMEKKTLQGNAYEGISLPRLLNSIDNLDDNARISFVTGISGGVTIYYVGGQIENVTELLIGSQDNNSIMLGDLKNPDNKYFLAYNVEKNTAPTIVENSGALIPRSIYLTQLMQEKEIEPTPADLLALGDKQGINMASYSTRATEGTKKEKIVLKAAAKQVIQEAESGAVLLFSASPESIGVTLQISREMMAQMQAKELYLQVNTAQGAYVISADVLDMSGITKELGSEDFVVQIQMNEVSSEQVKTIKSSLPANYNLQSVPMSTEIICVAGKKQIKISNFATYIFRDLLLSEKVIPAQGTVLCWDDGRDIPRVVPAIFMERNGQTYARAYSCSNSIYAVVAGSQTFIDMQQHAAKNDVELLASKLILSGKDSHKFDPNGLVNRAELATMLVRALGLKEPSGLQAGFKDVKGNEWFADSIATAAQAKIVNGMPDGTFQPLRNINRQETMVMISNAMQTAGMISEIGAEENDVLIAGFDDHLAIADWAKPAVAAVVKNGLIKSEGDFVAEHQINRAESAVLVAVLLRAIGFIDERDSLSTELASVDTKTKTSNTSISEDTKGVLVVEGTALTGKKRYTLDDLKAMSDIMVNDNYFSRGKAKEGWAAEQHDTFTGVSIYKLLLDKIGLKTHPRQIQIIGDDGFTKIFSLEEVTGLYMDETNPQAKLEMIIAWSRNGMEFQGQAQPFRIVFGQQYEGDFNRQNWVNYVKKIIVY